jgi:hypothetical protein
MSRPTRESLSDDDPDLVFADGFDAAILGIVERADEPTFVLYDGRRCIQLLVRREDMDREEAEEHFAENVAGSWVGERTPGFLWVGRGEDDDEDE